MTYAAFWHRYLRAHARPQTRAMHYAGTSLALACLARGAVRRDWRWLAAAPVVGYGAAWTAHFGLEGNRPETFGHPAWSLASDLRMLGLALAGRLGPHLRAAGVAEAGVAKAGAGTAARPRRRGVARVSARSRTG